MHYFGLQTRSLRKERKRKEKKRKEKKRKKEKQVQGMNSCIHDFGMIFVQEFLGYDC